MSFSRPSRRMSGVLSAVLLAALASTSLSTPVSASTASDAEAMIVNLINKDRIAAGLVPLRRRSSHAAVAGLRASRMAERNVASHSVGGDLGAQLDGRNVNWYRYGETIGYSYRTWAAGAAQNLYNMWMASDHHRALLMSPKFNYVGVGLAFRSSNRRTFGSVVLSESADVSGARSWIVNVNVSGNDIRWSWGGADLRLQTHTAGLRDYDVQYRVGSGSWRTLRNDTTSTSLTRWNRTSGVSYALRVRATDRRGNVGPWTRESRVRLP